MCETFNNIKMIKLFGWENVFGDRIKKVRQEIEEIDKTCNKRDAINGRFHHVVYCTIPLIVYSLYILNGNQLTLSFVIMSGNYIGRLQHLRHILPHQMRQWRHMKRKYTKLQDFMD